MGEATPRLTKWWSIITGCFNFRATKKKKAKAD